MRPDRVSNPGPLTYESGVLPTALRGPAIQDTVNSKESEHVSCTWANFTSQWRVSGK